MIPLTKSQANLKNWSSLNCMIHSDVQKTHVMMFRNTARHKSTWWKDVEGIRKRQRRPSNTETERLGQVPNKNAFELHGRPPAQLPGALVQRRSPVTALHLTSLHSAVEKERGLSSYLLHQRAEPHKNVLSVLCCAVSLINNFKIAKEKSTFS